MNPQWKTEIVPGAVVTSDHDDDVNLWQVIAVDENFAWIRLHTHRDKQGVNTDECKYRA
jgi:hypothetical protein